MRKRIIIPLLAVFFLLEGLLVPILTKANYASGISIFPRLVLVTIIYVAIYHKRNDALLLAIIFGVLTDIIYGRVYCVYTISLIGVVFLCIALERMHHPSFFYYLIMQIIVISTFEIFIFGLLKIYGLVTMHFGDMMMNIFFPSLLFNLLVAAALYPLLLRLIGRENY